MESCVTSHQYIGHMEREAKIKVSSKDLISWQSILTCYEKKFCLRLSVPINCSMQLAMVLGDHILIVKVCF